jgi:cation diffusion facilitator CzcD-associated flavoprotein CzcO
MGVLRTPKFLVGTELGVPSLAVESYVTARFGHEAWLAIDRVPRLVWNDYLAWYRTTLNLPVRNATRVVAVRELDARTLVVETEGRGGPDQVFARRVVLATGYDGVGEWRIPDVIRQAVPEGRIFHSNGSVPMERFAGKRVGILGHGASSFDNASAALAAGAERVDLCFRRPALPRVNPHRWVEFVGFLKHFPEMSDATRWRVNLHFKQVDQPPARWGFDTARAHPNFAMHAGSPWTEVTWDEASETIAVRTPKARFVFDYVIAATGSVVDLAAKPELSAFHGDILPWHEVYTPEPGEEHPALGKFPYLGQEYQYRSRDPAKAGFLNKVFAFNFAGIVSMGPHSTSISGHKYSVPRVLSGITRSFHLEQEALLLPELKAYDEPDLTYDAEVDAPDIRVAE